MKRIILIIMLVALLLMGITALALEDFTPETWPEYPTDSQDPIDIGVLGQIQSRVSQLGEKVDDVKEEAGKCFKAADVDKLKQEISSQMERNLGDILGKMVALLLIWQVFFFATLFLAKSKGWF